MDLKVNLSYKCDFNTYYVNKFISASRQQRPHVHAVIFNREGSCYGSFEAIKVMPELRFYSDPISMMHDNFTKDRLEVIGATLSMIVTVANKFISPSQLTLAKKSNTSVSTVYRAFKTAQALGLIASYGNFRDVCHVKASSYFFREDLAPDFYEIFKNVKSAETYLQALGYEKADRLIKINIIRKNNYDSLSKNEYHSMPDSQFESADTNLNIVFSANASQINIQKRESVRIPDYVERLSCLGVLTLQQRIGLSMFTEKIIKQAEWLFMEKRVGRPRDAFKVFCRLCNDATKQQREQRNDTLTFMLRRRYGITESNKAPSMGMTDVGVQPRSSCTPGLKDKNVYCDDVDLSIKPMEIIVNEMNKTPKVAPKPPATNPVTDNIAQLVADFLSKGRFKNVGSR